MVDVQKNEIVRFRDGDRVAFEALYRRYWRKVLSFTRLYIKDSYEQEEVVQQVFIRLWENRTKVDAGKDFDGFLFIVTRNLIFNRARHSFTAESLADFIDGAGPEFYHDIEGGIDSGFLREAVERLVTQLPPRQREAFVLSRRDGMSIREIAGVMGITEKGVKYIPVEGASGRAVATNLGDSPTNYLEWADVFSLKGGKYRISVRFSSPEAVDFDLVVNGKAHHASVAATDSAFVEIPFEVEFLKGGGE